MAQDTAQANAREIPQKKGKKELSVPEYVSQLQEAIVHKVKCLAGYTSTDTQLYQKKQAVIKEDIVEALTKARECEEKNKRIEWLQNLGKEFLDAAERGSATALAHLRTHLKMPSNEKAKNVAKEFTKQVQNEIADLSMKNLLKRGERRLDASGESSSSVAKPSGPNLPERAEGTGCLVTEVSFASRLH